MEKKLPISVCIISGAEAQRIGRALESVAGWTAEIVIVLNQEVTDGTDEIARRYGARVSREPWRGFIAQKNSVCAKATQPWLLGLDADEVVSPELRDEIIALFQRPDAVAACAAYDMPRLTRFCGRWIRHGDWYPDRTTRLWQKALADWRGVDPHARLEVRGKTGRLRRQLLHYHPASLDDQIDKMVSYSNDFVQDAVQRGRNASWFDLAFRPWWRFIRAYFFRLGLLDGWQGYYIAWMGAFHAATRYAKVRVAMAPKTEEPLR